MEDRFKFRHWDERINKMFYPERNDNFGYYVHNSDIIETMQCTGLKDKNGKLIYEGDIVKQGDAKYVVNWLEGTFCFKGLKTLHNFTIEYVVPSKQEVIGNRYENPELLED